MENVFYTIDRSGELSSGITIDLQEPKGFKPDEVWAHLQSLYPDGLSRHGLRYLHSPNSNFSAKNSSPCIEILWDEIRKARFKNLPSRFTSMFACKTLTDCMKLSKLFNLNGKKIYEVFPVGKYSIHNMNLLSIQGSVLYASYMADEYWNGRCGPDSHDDAIWEVIVELPANIGKHVATTWVPSLVQK